MSTKMKPFPFFILYCLEAIITAVGSDSGDWSGSQLESMYLNWVWRVLVLEVV